MRLGAVWVTATLLMTAGQAIDSQAAEMDSVRVLERRVQPDQVSPELKLNAAAYSSVREFADRFKFFLHRVCNQNASGGPTLKFEWPAAGFKSGEVRPLDGNQCSLHVREVARQEEKSWIPDGNTSTYYTTQESKRGMTTFRDKPSDLERTLDKALSYVGLERPVLGGLDEGTLVRMDTLSKGVEGFEHLVRWGTENVGVIVALPPLAPRQLEELQGLLRRGGLSERSGLMTLSQLLDRDDRLRDERALLLRHFGDGRRLVLYLQAELFKSGEFRFAVSVPPGDGAPLAIDVPIVALDRKGFVQTAFHYTSTNSKRSAKK